MVNCILIDDDVVALNVIKHYVTSTDGLHLLQAFTDAVEAANFLKNATDVDLVFMDIEMPDMNGLELMQSVKNMPPVILVSAKDNYAIKAFEQRAFHYLQKPLSYAAFLGAIGQFCKVRRPEVKTTDHIFVKENGTMTRLKYDDILYFEAWGDYVKVHCKNKVYVVNSTMKSIEDKLQHNPLFLRIHRTFHINIHYLESFDTDTAIVCNKTIPIGQKYRPDLQSRLMII